MKKPFVVGVAGGSGSGKSFFVNKLCKSLTATIHAMDNYYLDIEQQPKDENEIENFDKLESIDRDRYLSDLKQLINGESISLKEYTYNNTDQNNIITLESNPIIIVDGIFVLHYPEIRELLDLKIYIKSPDHLMIKRRILRDAKERGYDLDDVLYRFEYHVMPAFQRYIDPSKRYADIIIPNHQHIDTSVEVIWTFLTSKLHSQS